MPVEVIVKLAVTADEPARSALDACARELGVSIAQLHQATANRDLASYFVTSVESQALPDVIARLRRCPGVEGVYAKPAGEPPEERM